MYDQKRATEQEQTRGQLSDEDLEMVAGGRDTSVQEPAEATLSTVHT
jgi:hypothetical protein